VQGSTTTTAGVAEHNGRVNGVEEEAILPTSSTKYGDTWQTIGTTNEGAFFFAMFSIVLAAFLPAFLVFVTLELSFSILPSESIFFLLASESFFFPLELTLTSVYQSSSSSSSVVMLEPVDALESELNLCFSSLTREALHVSFVSRICHVYN